MANSKRRSHNRQQSNSSQILFSSFILFLFQFVCAALVAHFFSSSRRRCAIDHRRLFVYNISSPFPSIILLCESFIHFRQLFVFYEFLREHIACSWILNSAKFGYIAIHCVRVCRDRCIFFSLFPPLRPSSFEFLVDASAPLAVRQY